MKKNKNDAIVLVFIKGFAHLVDFKSSHFYSSKPSMVTIFAGLIHNI